jgi:hypothetical protein
MIAMWEKSGFFIKLNFVIWFKLAVHNLEATVHNLELDAFLLLDLERRRKNTACGHRRLTLIPFYGYSLARHGIIFKIYDF